MNEARFSVYPYNIQIQNNTLPALLSNVTVAVHSSRWDLTCFVQYTWGTTRCLFASTLELCLSLPETSDDKSSLAFIWRLAGRKIKEKRKRERGPGRELGRGCEVQKGQGNVGVGQDGSRAWDTRLRGTPRAEVLLAADTQRDDGLFHWGFTNMWLGFS